MAPPQATLRGSMASAAEARAEAAALVAKLEECRVQASAGIRAVADLEAAAQELAAARAKLDEQQGQLAELESLRAYVAKTVTTSHLRVPVTASPPRADVASDT